MVASHAPRRPRPRRARHHPRWSWREFKQQVLTPAFRELRSCGILAHTTHLEFTNSSVHHQLSTAVDASNGKYTGYVGYSLQAVPFDKDGWDESFDAIYLQHSLTPNVDDDDSVIDSQTVGAVRGAFVKLGVAVEWQGERNTSILLRPPKSSTEMWDKLRAHVTLRRIFWYWHGLPTHLHANPVESAKRQRSNIRYDPDEPNAPPGGLDPGFNVLHFDRSITFVPPYDANGRIDTGSWKYFEGSDYGDEDDDGPPDWQLNIEFYWNGGDVDKLTLDPPSRFDDEVADGDADANPFIQLKGEELDAIAFRGPVVKFASYARMGGAFDDVTEYRAPSGNCFTIAELHSVLEKHLFWLARAEQFQKRLNIDHCFFEGLNEREGDGALCVHWGS